MARAPRREVIDERAVGIFTALLRQSLRAASVFVRGGDAGSGRNFEHRQGPRVRTHLVSPATAAATAIAGRIADVRQFPGRA